MILGFDYQTPEIVAQELDGLMKLKPALGQYLIYGPVPGTPFGERVMKEGLLHERYIRDRESMYRIADGFTAGMKHPTLSAEEIEGLQRWCFEQDFQRLGPSIFRVLEGRFLGYQKLKNSPNPFLRRKAEVYAKDLRCAYPVFLAGRLLGPNAAVRHWIGDLEQRIHAELGRPALAERFKSVMAVGAALWTAVTLKLDLFQHPRLMRTTYRMPAKRWSEFHLWEEIPHKISIPELAIRVELQHAKKQVWLRLEGALSASACGTIGPTHPRFVGAEQEPSRSGLEQAPLGQGGRPASPEGEARGVSLANPSRPAQVVGGASRTDSSGQHVPPLQRLNGVRSWGGDGEC